MYSLSIRHRAVKHYRINRLPNNWYYISPRLTFQCLEELVSHYSGKDMLTKPVVLFSSREACTVCFSSHSMITMALVKVVEWCHTNSPVKLIWPCYGYYLMLWDWYDHVMIMITYDPFKNICLNNKQQQRNRVETHWLEIPLSQFVFWAEGCEMSDQAAFCIPLIPDAADGLCCVLTGPCMRTFDCAWTQLNSAPPVDNPHTFDWKYVNR